MAADSYHMLFERVVRRRPLFRAWAWGQSPLSSNTDMRLAPQFYYDFDLELSLLIRGMRLEQSWRPSHLRRRRLRREMEALRRRRESEDATPLTLTEVNARLTAEAKSKMDKWKGIQASDSNAPSANAP